ncbi:MAG: acyltransferase [Myxococcales bacterium]|nr:acyltransferase [Myxococcales bacterium]
MSFRPELHRLRGLAIACIVAGHCGSFVQWGGLTPTVHATGVLFCNWTVVFVFIAGYLFHHLGAARSYGAFVRKKLRYVAAPYVLTSLPVLVGFAMHLHPEPGFGRLLWGGFAPGRYLAYLFTGAHAIHTWFIPVMLGLFALAPLWRRAARGRARALTPLLVLSVLVAVAFPRASSHDPRLLLLNLVHFSSCFLFGIWWAKHRAALDRHTRAIVAVGLALVASTLAHEWLTPGGHVVLGNRWNYVLKMALCPLLLVALQRPLPRLLDRGLGRLAELSFGVYFVHMYWLDLLTGRWAIGVRGHFFGWPGWLWQTTAVLGLSVATVLVLRRLAGRHARAVVGVKPEARPARRSLTAAVNLAPQA